MAHVGSSLACYPNYLSYANEAWGGPGNLYRVLPGTDSAQGYLQVAKYMKQHTGVPCWVDGIYWVRPTTYVPECTPFGSMYLAELPPVMRGIIFISGSQIQMEGKDHEELAPFGKVAPTDKIGGSAMLVYEGSFDTHLAAARVFDTRARAAVNRGESADGLANAQQAMELAPDSATAQFSFGVVLMQVGRYQEAMPHCQAAYDYAAPNHNLRMTHWASDCMHLLNERYGVPLPRGLQLPPFQGK